MRSDKFTLSRRATLGLAAGAALAAPLPLRAQTYPDRPVTILVPFATGGYNDRYARAFAPFLAKQLGQPVTVINRPGGGTVLGNTFYLQQPDDGYMIMMHSAAPYIPLSILLRNAPYKAEDFWMINLPSRDATLCATATTKPTASIDAAVAALKANPAALTVGVQPASADLVNLALLVQAHGIDRSRMRIVTYDGGGPARTATMGGHVDIGLVGAEGFLPIKERIRPLLMFDEEKFEGFEETKLITDHAKQHGFEPEFVAGSQRGFVVLRRFVEKMPERYRILEAAIERATKDPDCVATLKGQQLATTWYGPEASNRAYLATHRTMAKYADLLKAS
ncbi:tripartite tricarboxylate transporter substrate binding protein [Elioraea sp. Yellowstone]|jgi:tripartite-type tricarboxylate transporter receptor subunit TctC|uniref:tripartite tricarboxylate transporter substrate binding protein n=1 Tax=Elioraea sp. Yellowstone TaxID=2592070 RepID=UPI0011533E70|nr:tripartite tricarboxylate transporter substrate binding protein [Elioraea sp. Yellowstone]TQF81807.1 tripartite tricarboxylate transporter substrate binding protein [Elioraea sp. Yellowstone]